MQTGSHQEGIWVITPEHPASNLLKGMKEIKMKPENSIPESVIEQLSKTAPGLEIWWDSSPLVYENWAKQVLTDAPEEKRAILEVQLRRLYDPDNTTQSLFRGVTTNPPLSLNAIKDDPERWKAWIQIYQKENPAACVNEVFWELYKEIVRTGAQIFLPIFNASGYRFGHISGQVDPRAAFDADRMLAQALELSSLAPNVMVKVPGTAEGMRVIRQLTAHGVSTNATLCYVVAQFVAVAEAVQAGLLEARRNGVDLTCWRSVVTQMSARWEDAVEFREQAEAAGFELTTEYKRWGSLSIFKRAHQIFRQRAYPSKMLICSLRLGPVVNGQQRVWHLEHTAGADAVFTLPPVYIAQLLLQADNIEFKPRIWEPVPEAFLVALNKVPYFVHGMDEHGYIHAEFNTLPPLCTTYNEFSVATEKMVSFVREHMQEPIVTNELN